MKKVLVTGGCGFIGSHTIVELILGGFEVICVDNLSNSSNLSLDGVAKITGKKITNYQLDIRDKKALDQLYVEHPDIVGVIHFAALKAVGESMEQALRYYSNNVSGMIQLIEWVVQHEIRNFIFSSSCTVYGETKELPVTELSPFQKASSPYGFSKQFGEQILSDVCKNANLKAISLRYFNPAGAHESCFIGESPSNTALNLVPVITETAIHKREKMTVFGLDYPTPDGTCVRDYIHVVDLANAHVLALAHLIDGKQTLDYDFYNLGLGKGISVLEAINAFKKVNQRDVNVVYGKRRPGDLASIFADCSKAQKQLHWIPKYDIDDIMKSAWAWELVRNK